MTNKIVIIDYGMGNTLSISNAIVKLGYNAVISCKKEDVNDADGLILPGVGTFKEAMRNLYNKNIITVLEENVIHNKKPILGICLGMQIMANSGEEMGHTKGLQWIDGKVEKIQIPNLSIPHVGWNSIDIIMETPLFKNIRGDSHFYFDHSYHFVCDKQYISSYTEYKESIVASIQKENIFATQFHPEKSQNLGLKLMRNFLNYVEEN